MTIFPFVYFFTRFATSLEDFMVVFLLFIIFSYCTYYRILHNKKITINKIAAKNKKIKWFLAIQCFIWCAHTLPNLQTLLPTDFFLFFNRFEAG